MHKWRIPQHPVGQFTNPFASLDIELFPATHAVSRTKNCTQRLHHLITASRHRTLQGAATELGVRWGTLDYQVKRIEETAGFTIIDVGRSRPLTLTSQGIAFLAEAEALLNLLNNNSE